MRARFERGLSLVELMVALAIGSILIAGAGYVYVQSRNSFGVNENVARLQETARYAMSIIEPDVRMSSFWGLVNDPELINGRGRPADPAVAVPTGTPHVCGNNFAFDAYATVQGSDNSYDAACAPGPNGNAQLNTDTLTIRRASANPNVPTGARLQIWTTRTLGTIFSNVAAPGPLAPIGQVNDLIVNSYYVSADSDGRLGLPSLRRQALIPGPTFQDQEIVPGVEDLQIQLGIDPNGTVGDATRYVNPEAVIPPASQVVSVRLWILVRSENPEVGFTDDRTYRLGNRVYTPNDGFRRVLFTRTIQVRNSLG